MARTKQGDFTQAATLTVSDYEINNKLKIETKNNSNKDNNNKNNNTNNNTSLQIVNVSHNARTELLDENKINTWKRIFSLCDKNNSKEEVLKRFDEYHVNAWILCGANVAFSGVCNGINIMHNDKIFQTYADKFKKNKNFPLCSNDMIHMRNQSKIMAKMIHCDGFASSYLKEITRGYVDKTGT